MKASHRSWIVGVLLLSPSAVWAQLATTEFHQLNRFLGVLKKDPLIPNVLVPDSHPFFNARLVCRELHPFCRNRARWIDVGGYGVKGRASTQGFLTVP